MAFTKKDIKALLEASQLEPKDLALKLGVEIKTLRTWLSGASQPTHPRSLAKLRTAFTEYNVRLPNTEKEEVEPTVQTELELDATPAAENTNEATPMLILAYSGKEAITNLQLREMRKNLGLSVVEISQQLKCNGASYYAYESGKRIPRRDYTKKMIATLWRTYQANSQSSVDKPTPVRATVAASILLDKASRFYATKQTELNRRLVKEVVSFVAEEHKLDMRVTQEAVSTFLTLLKGRLSLEEIYSLLTGHTA